MITLVIPDFRALFPQFTDVIKFPDIRISSDFDLATGYVSPEVCGGMREAVRKQALYLMTAHLLALGVVIAQNNYTGQPGIVTSATIDKISVTLAPPPLRSQWRWWLNTTPYGAQLVALLDMQSAGGFFVGGLPERAAFRKVGGVF